VRATFTLDSAAVARVGSTAAVRLDDLQHAGWTVTRDATSITLTHDFANVSELGQLLSAAGGVLGDPKVVHEHDRFSTKERFSVVADTSALGAGVKSDATLARSLQAAGLNVDALAPQLDRELREAVHLTITLRLPNGTTRTVAVRNGAATTVAAVTTTSSQTGVWLVIAGVVLGATALGLFILSFRRKRRAIPETR
jgi:LPXTG-motif cell wall-anchored protein